MKALRSSGSRPSPAIVVAVLALVAALAGSAIAANPVNTAVSKKSTKKIAKKEAKKFFNANIGDATVANAEQLDGVPASGYLSDSAVRYAAIDAAGGLLAPSKGIAQANVTKDGAGFYCIDGLDPEPQAVSATLSVNAFAGARLYAGLKSGGGVCAGKQIIVQTQNNSLTNTDNPFTIIVF